MELLNQIETLTEDCSSEENKLVEKMIFNVAEYVQAVVQMDTTARNLIGREQEELRDAVSTTDRTRTTVHDGLISSLNIVNRICAKHNFPPAYTGDEERRHYGDFAFALVEEIFRSRK